MNTREFFLRRLEAERPAFVSVIRALPEGRLAYKPDERNTSAGDIAWFLALELGALAELARSYEMHWKQLPRPGSIDAIVAAYEAAADDLRKTLVAMDDAGWERECRLYFGDRLVKRAPLGETLWDFFFDAIHHRGQLTAYLRPMGGKVPSTYGPTADSQGS